jgi:hypothetical protein
MVSNGNVTVNDELKSAVVIRGEVQKSSAGTSGFRAEISDRKALYSLCEAEKRPITIYFFHGEIRALNFFV